MSESVSSTTSTCQATALRPKTHREGLACVVAAGQAYIWMPVIGIDVDQFAPAQAYAPFLRSFRTTGRERTERKVWTSFATREPHIKDPPYFGEPKLARLMSKPLGCALAAVWGNVIFSPPCSMTNLLSAS